MTMIVSPRESRAPAARPAIWTQAAGRSVAWVRHQVVADMGVRRDQVGLAVRDAYRAERVPR
jgi:hypothetical protein